MKKVKIYNFKQLGITKVNIFDLTLGLFFEQSRNSDIELRRKYNSRKLSNLALDNVSSVLISNFKT